MRGVLEYQTNQRLVIRVRVGLVLEQGNRPPSLTVPDGIRIPVGALDQPDRHGSLTLPRPRQHRFNVRVGVPSVRLQRKPCVRIRR